MYTDSPTEWALANLPNPADRPECPRQFLILQAKKVRSDLSDKAKADATQAVATRVKRGAAPTATPTSPASPRTATASTTTGTPRTPRNPVATRSPAAIRSPVATSSPLATRRALTTRRELTTRRALTPRGALTSRKQARNEDDAAEIPGAHLQSGRDKWSCQCCGLGLSVSPSAVLTVPEPTLQPALVSTSSPALAAGLHNLAQSPCYSRRILSYGMNSTLTSFPPWRRWEGRNWVSRTKNHGTRH